MLRPCHLFAFVDTSHDTHWFMNRSRSGCGIVVLYICRSAKNLVYVSGLRSSHEKYTEATTPFRPRSKLASSEASLMIAWLFWRGALIEVWTTSLTCLPPCPRSPTAPFFQPPSAGSLFALSTLNS